MAISYGWDRECGNGKKTKQNKMVSKAAARMFALAVMEVAFVSKGRGRGGGVVPCVERERER